MSINDKIYNKTIAHQQNVLNFIKHNALVISKKTKDNSDELRKEILLFLSENLALFLFFPSYSFSFNVVLA